MKFDIDSILIQERLTELAHEALEAYEVITKAYENAFSLGKTELPCYSSYIGDFHHSATITVDGLWKYQSEYNCNKTYEVQLTENGIFTCFVAELAKTGVRSLSDQIDDLIYGTENKPSFDFGLTPEEEELSEAADDLRDFVANCKRKLEEQEKAKNKKDENNSVDTW